MLGLVRAGRSVAEVARLEVSDQNYRTSGGTWVGNFGAMSCALGMSGTFGVPKANPATSWTTATSGTTC